MTAQCFMPVYNEADLLPHVLAHMRSQGVDVHALDGWSSDGCWEILRDAGPGVTAERFPARADDGVWNCRRTLRRVESLAQASKADWCCLSDVDEWRRSPRPGETLAEGIARWDAEGYTVIDHRVYAFFCTDSGWTGGPEKYFRWYNTRDMLCTLAQQKIWKNVGRVNLVDSGGHTIRFPRKRVAPEWFTMKHYPFRTPAQAREKLETRLARRCHEEHQAGWGVHYDEFPPGFSFCWNPADLKWWSNTESALP